METSPRSSSANVTVQDRFPFGCVMHSADGMLVQSDGNDDDADDM